MRKNKRTIRHLRHRKKEEENSFEILLLLLLLSSFSSSSSDHQKQSDRHREEKIYADKYSISRTNLTKWKWNRRNKPNKSTSQKNSITLPFRLTAVTVGSFWSLVSWVFFFLFSFNFAFWSIFQLINLIIDGFLYAFGAISNDIKNSYRCPEWAVSAVISLACGFYLLSGLLIKNQFRSVKT